VRRRVTRILPLSVVVCVLGCISALSVLAQSKTTQSSKNVSTPVQQSSKSSSKSSTTAPAVAAVPKVDNAPTINFISPLEREIIDEINLARTNPQKYISFLEEYRSYYKGNSLTLPGSKSALVTNEGLAAVEEAINYLRAQKPLPALTLAKGVCFAARDHAKDMTLKGITGHKGSDGSVPDTRVQRYGFWDGTVGENIIYDIRTARQMVIGMIIDDGVANRGHRHNIFDTTYRVTGISISDAASNPARGVIVYVGGFTDKAGSTNH
jgi:uncharacterized protein YkwD